MAKLYFRYGAMGSSKTANAIMVQYNYQERGQSALMLKPRLDDRDGARVVGSRSGLSAPCRFVEELPEIDVRQYDCVIVDEAQFMTKAQVASLVRIVDEMDIPVICYGLRADFQGNLFEGSLWLLTWADSIEELKTVCWCGRKAVCNTRVINGRVTKEGEQIMLGGSESYVALCRKHWAKGELAPREIRRIVSGKREFMPLLLEADPEERAIERYLDKSDLYVLLESGRAVSEIALYPRPDGHIEVKSLATDLAARGRGYAGELIRHAIRLCTTKYQRMYVGTDRSMIPYYEKFGFRPDYVEPNFFVDNYENPIVVDGVRLRDMHYLSMELGGRQGGKAI
jgi:thymidine kinase